MKSIQLLIIAATTILAACSDNSVSEECVQAELAAARDAEKVAEASPGSMQQEQAVLAIKVREHALRQAGYEKAADAYIAKAGYILIDSLNIISPDSLQND